MTKIDLRAYYKSLYPSATFCEVPERIKEALEELKRLEHAQSERKRYHGDTFVYLDDYHYVDLEDESLSTEEQYFEQGMRRELYQAMLRLPKTQMRRIYAYFFLELRLTQIARIEKVSVAAVSASIKQGILNLKRYLKDN